MEKNIIINGDNCSSLFPRFGYVVSYKKIHGSAGGTMLDGSITEDVIALKAEIKLTLMPFTEKALSDFLSSLYGSDYAVVNYFDPMVNAYKTIEAIVGEIETQHSFINCNKDDIWMSGTLTLTER